MAMLISRSIQICIEFTLNSKPWPDDLTKRFPKVPKMEGSSSPMFLLYGYGDYVRENPPPKKISRL